jgi:hypothetical protein
MGGIFDVLHEIAVHLDMPIKIEYGRDHEYEIEPRPFQVPAIDSGKLSCMRDRMREYVFNYTHEDGHDIAGEFRFLLPVTEGGKVNFGCIVDSTFKMFIDSDGDLCLTTPLYKTEDLPIAFSFDDEDQDWDTDEIRGIYRYKYGQRPPASPQRYSSGVDSSILEIVDRWFRWTQDGLLVGLPSFRGRYIEEELERGREDREKEHERAEALFRLVPLPGLNAADIDLRNHARLTLNVQRDNFQRDASMETFEKQYYAVGAEMWAKILKQENALSSDGGNFELVEQLLAQSPEPLRMQLRSLLPEIADGDFMEFGGRRRRSRRHP